MAGQVTIERRDSGELVARKGPIDGADVGALRREALVLERVEGDGVVELLAVLPEGSTPGTPNGDEVAAPFGPALELGYLGASLETSGALDATTAVRLMAQTAAALARAHAAGISHGRLVASHVLRDARGGAVVCSWGAAGARPDLVELAPGPAFDPAGDVAQLGALLVELLEAGGPAGSAPRGRGRARLDQRLRTKAGAVAAAARHPNPELRPSMAELAERLADMVPAPSLGGASGPAGARPDEGRGPGLTALAAVNRVFGGVTAGRRSPRSTQLAVVAGVAALAAVVTVVGVAPFGDGGPSRAAGAPATVPLSAGTPATAAPATGPEATVVPAAPPAAVAAPCPTTADELAAGGLPAACSSGLVVSGREIRLGDARYVLGEEDDQVVLADLRCDGFARPMLLRPGSGELYTFDTWASSGADADGRLLGHLPGSVSIEAGPAACGEVVVVAGDGLRTTLQGEELR